MRFNRISILHLSGLFTKIQSDGKYFESKYLKIRAYIICVIAFTALFRLFICQFYSQNDFHQLFIGNLFNHLNLYSRFFLAIAGIDGISLIICLLINFRYLNNNEEKLILLWLKMTECITIDDQFKVIGISKEENKRYWIKQNNFNHKFEHGFYIYLSFICLSFNLPLVFMRYDVKILIFILNLIVLIVHYSIYMHYILKILFFFNFFFFEIIFFFYFKLDKLIMKLNEINQIKNKNYFNLKLTKLIYQFSFIYLEMHKMNTLFNKFIGICYFHLFLGEIIFVFVAVFGDVNLKIAMSVLIFSMFILVLYFPFYLSNQLTVKIHKVNFILQNLTFNLITTKSNKYKINHISSILKFNNGYVFQCFNLFPLNSNYAFNTGLQIIMNSLLLIRISNILYN